jgi:DNA-binding NarL/FixJ family response regulator
MTRKSNKKQIYIVDDHPMMRDGLRALIEGQSDLEVCGEAEDAAPALADIERIKPDLAILDISLRSGNGLELIKDLQARAPSVVVLAITMHDESLYAERVLRAGGRGYIMKQEGGKRILEGIRAVLAGQTFVSANVSARILGSLSGRQAGATGGVEKLTDREFEVFQCIGRGLGTKDIAEKLKVSVKTVEVHRVHIKEKLGIATAPELIHFAVRWAEAQGK